VAVDPAMPCHRCDQCLAGRRHTCREIRFLGCPGQAEGCLADRIVMPMECCFPVQEDTTLEQAAMIEPLSVGVYGVQTSVPLRGAKIAILGCGPIGLSVLLAAKAAGAEHIYVTDRIDARLDVARDAGAAWSGNPDRSDVVADLAAREPLRMDAVFECCGQQDALDQAVDMLKPGGRLMLIGIPEADRVSFCMDGMRRKEICIQNVRRQNECMQPAIDLVESGAVDVDFMLTHRFAFEDTKQAFDMVAGYEDGVVKAVIDCG
jgi:L-iditol 2-dehydrogenase